MKPKTPTSRRAIIPRWFYPNVSGIVCCVNHAPGTCCHFGEAETEPPPPQAHG